MKLIVIAMGITIGIRIKREKIIQILYQNCQCFPKSVDGYPKRTTLCPTFSQNLVPFCHRCIYIPIVVKKMQTAILLEY